MSVNSEQIVQVLMRQRTKLLAYIRVIVRDNHMAEDVLQEVSMLAVRKADQIDGAEGIERWVFKAARLEAMNFLRRRHSDPLTLDAAVLDAIDARLTAAAALPDSDVSDALTQCVEQLSPYARRLVQMRYGEGLTGQRLAESLDRKLNTVYVALTRIHHVLQDCVRTRMEQAHG
ncbi:MAG: sigma-70 family RNA polymerase sigma factor [Phycisphaera sp.]|nr:sigma-70 family RNA polymerase sigma factor [Phycisphaera sp.]